MLTRKIKNRLCLSCAAALILIMASGCNRNAADDDIGDVEVIVMPVLAAVAAKQDVTRALSFAGSMDAFRRAAIAPAMMGSRVQRIFVEEGQMVREGQVLVQMEAFRLDQLGVQLDQLEADYKRMAALRQTGGVTMQQYEQIRSAFQAAKAGHEQMRGSVELRAPFAGTVIGRYANEGEVYTGTPGFDGTMGVLAIAQLNRMRIEVMVPEQFFAMLRPGQAAQVRVDVFPDTVFEGRIFTVNPSFNRLSRASRVVIEIANNRQLLKPGMIARVEIAAHSLQNVLAVPSTAIIIRDYETHVFTVEDKPVPFTTTPSLVRVKTGFATEHYTQIIEGIDKGVIVLTDNNISLTDETVVLVTDIQNGGVR
ncbi:MAG: efflux RND transporter periplasmic adaptor subunit [Chitinispirillales bacterium]|jgi:RND family efflux transporter MFP subunit|nr:efflux RND transporter periplasmic adaptor subunit [Chitinispirillales bacterium]